MSEKRITRRKAIKRVAYTTPVILTTLAAPSFAAAGSGDYKNDHKNASNKRLNIKSKK
jgi:hypothetical protein